VIIVVYNAILWYRYPENCSAYVPMILKEFCSSKINGLVMKNFFREIVTLWYSCTYIYIQVSVRDITLECLERHIVFVLSVLSICPSQFVSATPLKLQNRISWNLVGSKDTICSCAYYHITLECLQITPTKFRGSKFPGNMHNYIWCPYYLPSFMKLCSVVSEELHWQAECHYFSEKVFHHQSIDFRRTKLL
jgi:hypothetical protein